MLRTLIAVLVTVPAVAALWQPPVDAAESGPPRTAGGFDVRHYGATGDGAAYDDDAIDRAIEAAAARHGTVVFPPGRYRARTIHLRSHVTLRLDAGATILAAAGGMDPAEPNPAYERYQDYGHSHFRNALMWGEHITDFAITGGGTIDGDMNLATANVVPDGVADKALSLKLCSNVTLSGVTFRHGGHFMVLMNGCRGVTIDHITTVAAETGVRDGINVINSSDVRVSRSRIEGSDDALD